MDDLLKTFDCIKQVVENVAAAFKKPLTQDDFTLVN